MIIAYTICSANYLPYAKSLADSFLAHHPNELFIIALADTFRDYDAAFFAPHPIISVQDMHIADLEHMNNAYDIFELSCALKPFVATYILNRYKQAESLFYFDSDILLFSSLEKSISILQQHSLVLTPHFTTLDLTNPDVTHFERNLLQTGLYNAGFFGVNRSPESCQFLHWWKERLRDYCYNDTRQGLFVDQLWLNLAPVYFKNAFILRDAGYNVAYWNSFERKVNQENGKFWVNETDLLVFFHFSGCNIEQSEILSKHKQEYTFENFTAYKPLFEKYKTAALKNNTNDFFSLPVTMGTNQAKKRKGIFALFKK